MKYIPVVLLAAALPVAAQMSDPTQAPDASQPAGASSSPSTASTDTNSAAATPAPIGPPLTNTPGMANPADSEPVVQAQPLDQATAAMASKSAQESAPTLTTSGNGAGPAALSPDPFSDPLIAQIVVRYQKAWDGDSKETKSLTADIERWIKDEPNNYLLMAYLGSVYALDSRDSMWPPAKLDYLKKGEKELDAAIAGDPSNPAIRLLRAMNYYELPALFGKHRAAHEDFSYLLQQLSGTLPMSYDLTNDTKQAIYYYAGLSDVQFSDKAGARDAWQHGLAVAPQSKLGGKMQAELSKLK